jgi:hypothetical protein
VSANAPIRVNIFSSGKASLIDDTVTLHQNGGQVYSNNKEEDDDKEEEEEAEKEEDIVICFSSVSDSV